MVIIVTSEYFIDSSSLFRQIRKNVSGKGRRIVQMKKLVLCSNRISHHIFQCVRTTLIQDYPRNKLGIKVVYGGWFLEYQDHDLPEKAISCKFSTTAASKNHHTIISIIPILHLRHNTVPLHLYYLHHNTHTHIWLGMSYRQCVWSWFIP